MGRLHRAVTCAIVLASAGLVRADVRYVKADAAGDNDGTSWVNAFTDLQDALAAATAGDEIWVAAAIYTPAPPGGDRSVSFELKAGVAIYGGFAGATTDFADRDPATNPTILSGDLNRNDAEVAGFALLNEPTRADNSYHVLVGSFDDGTGALDGFTITAGIANGSEASGDGGGMLSLFAPFTRASPGAPARPTLINCTFVGNAARERGGGVYHRGAHGTFIDCTFRGNFAAGSPGRPGTGGGGGMMSDASFPTLVNCRFLGNVAGVFGGGIYARNESDATLVNCTVGGNTSFRAGGGMANRAGSTASVANCIFWGNEPSQIALTFGTSAIITYSCVQGGAPGGGFGNIDADPQFVGADFEDVRLRPGSPCIDAGDNADVPADITTDPDGNARRVDDPTRPDTGNGTPPIVDMGAFEYQGDCNGNGAPDDQDIVDQVSKDCNRNGIPDECEPAVLPNCGTCMRYLANSADPGIGSAWTQSGFDDSAWNEGSFGVGYGAGGMLQTTVATGTRSVYTRATFQIDGDPAQSIENVFLGLDYDAGVVAWINGAEVFRDGMPAPVPDWDTLATPHPSSNSSSCASQDPQVDVNITDVASPFLVSGTNVLTIGVWHANDSDALALVPRLEINRPPVAILRGPYLQMGTDTSLVVRWRTDGTTNSQVLYGPAPDELVFAAQDSTVTAEHIVPLSGLEPETTYFYSIGSTTEQLAGGDTEHFFITNPVPGTVKPFRAWVLGDSGTANNNARAVRDAYYGFAGTQHTDLWLMLGDNAYNDGTDAEYQAAVFEMFPEMLRKSVFWPTFGNHEAPSADSPTQSGVYYDILSLPTLGEAGGFESGTEAYYSFDYANVHFISLDSQDTDRSPGGAMMQWLVEDVGDTLQDWIVAFWHHPPYSKGSHDSDSEGRLVDMREIAVPILEAAGVDLVLTGHSHSYERSVLIDGHYGLSGTLTGSMILDGGDGRPGGSGAYEKPTGGLAPREGAVYAVAGSSGRTSGGSLNHPVMHVSMSVLGSMVLDFDDLRLDAAFLDSTGAIRDTFTIVKGDCNAGGVPGKCDPADFDRDGDVDLADQVIFDAGFSGPDEPTPDPRTDLDGDGDTDLADLLILQAAFTGSQ